MDIKEQEQLACRITNLGFVGLKWSSSEDSWIAVDSFTVKELALQWFERQYGLTRLWRVENQQGTLIKSK